MKQNSRILFHHMRNYLIKSHLQKIKWMVLALALLLFHGFGAVAMASDKPEYLASFDPAKGFKPAQSDLTEVFLQIAGSLEAYGTPEPYLRHMKAEHERIEAKYQKQLGDKPRSFCPAYMGAAYFDRFAANWKHIAPQLGLETLTKNTGQQMRAVINGPDGKGTMLVEVFNQHQHEVYVAMTSKTKVQIPGFDTLKAKIVKCTRLDDGTPAKINLTMDQQAVVNPIQDIRTAFLKLFSTLDTGLPASDAQKVKTAILSIFTDVGCMAQSELEAAIVENSLDELRSPRPAYSAEQETALNAEERQIFAEFLKKARFTRSDLPALDKFYSTVYDKLSVHGKMQMHYRLQAGMRPPRPK